MAYADVSDIEVRMQRTFTTSETANVQALIDGASAVLDKLVTLDGSDEQLALLNLVCTNMVCRVLSAGVDLLGASQSSITAGPYTQSFSYSAPAGDFYLTKMEKRLLGVTSGYIGTLRPAVHRRRCGCGCDD